MHTAPTLEAQADRIARAVLATLDRYARGEDGPAIDAEYEALFWEGERVAEALAAASAVECAAPRRSAERASEEKKRGLRKKVLRVYASRRIL